MMVANATKKLKKSIGSIQMDEIDTTAPKVTIFKHGARMTNATYQCTNKQCKAESTLRFFSDEKPWPIIQCHECHAGRGLDLSAMLASSAGMVVIRKELDEEYVPEMTAVKE